MSEATLSKILYNSASEAAPAEDNTYESALAKTQAYLSEHHAQTLAETVLQEQARDTVRYLTEQFLTSNKVYVAGMSIHELTNRLYRDMAGYSILEEPLADPNVEEILVNAYNDVEIIDERGRHKYHESFATPEQGRDIARRLVRISGQTIDTAHTFDAYSYQLVENKQKFISQIFTSKSPARGAEDLDEMALSYAEVKALAAGNPAIREKMDLDVQVARLKLLKSNWQSERYRLEWRVSTELPTEITRLEHQIDHLNKDMQIYEQHKPPEEGGFSITLMGSTYDKRVEAGEKLTRLAELVPLGEVMKVGEYCGFTLRIRRPEMMSPPKLEIEGEGTYMAELGESVLGNITRIENLAKGMVAAKEKAEAQLANAKEQLKATKEELARPWAQEQELKEKSERLAQLNVELDVGGRDNSAAAMGDDDEEPEREAPSRERAAVR